MGWKFSELAASKSLTSPSKPLPTPSVRMPPPSQPDPSPLNPEPPPGRVCSTVSTPVKTVDCTSKYVPGPPKTLPRPTQDRWRTHSEVASPFALVRPLVFPSALLLTSRSLLRQGTSPVHLSEEVVRPKMGVASASAGRARERPVPVPTPSTTEPPVGQVGRDNEENRGGSSFNNLLYVSKERSRRPPQEGARLLFVLQTRDLYLSSPSGIVMVTPRTLSRAVLLEPSDDGTDYK